MPRITPITDKSQLPAERHAEVDAITAVLHGVRGPFSMLMHCPGLAQKVMEAGAHIRLNSTLTSAERELIILAVCREKDAAYEWTSHVGTGRKGGLAEASIEACRNRGPVDGLDDNDREIILFVRQLLEKNRVEQGLFDSMLKRHNERWLLEVAATVGQYQYISSITNTFGLEPAADAEDKLPV